VIFRPVVFTLGLALGAAAQAVAQLATPGPAPLTPAASVAPSLTPTPAATLAPPSISTAPVFTPTPSATPTPPIAPSTPAASATPTVTPTASATPIQFTYVVDPTPDPNAPSDAPQIVRIEINDRVVHAGGEFACRITTTPNVASVVLTVEGRQVSIPKAQDGLFGGIQHIPSFIPPWFLKTYQVTFNAFTADGEKAAATIPITLAY
jgi:hypothetical protein